MHRPQADPGFLLIACDADGRPKEPVTELPPPIAEACKGCSDLYKRLGYIPPWVSYIALYCGSAVGSGAFVGAPVAGRVEIAYFTLPEHEGHGYATFTAQGLIAIARDCQPEVEIFAKTAPEANSSTAILTKLGFAHIGVTVDHEIGEAWAWLLAPPPATLPSAPGGSAR